MTGGSFWIGLDLGTSGLKGVTLFEDGTVGARVQVAYRTNRPVPRAAEQDPGEWMEATRAVIAGLAREVDPLRWSGIGLSGMLPTLVTLDPSMRPNGSAITWEDGRAEPQGTRLRERLGADELYRMTGQWLDGRYLLPMFQRIVEEEPARAYATTAICSAKDYLFSQFTGELATDPSTAAGFGCYGLETGSWLPEIAKDWTSGTVPPALPLVMASATTRPLSEGPSSALGLPPGLPVCLGGADSVLGALGLGVSDDGEVAYVAGTSSVILGVSSRLVLDGSHRYLVTPMAEEAIWGLEMDLLATGSSLSWLATVLLGSPSPEAVGDLAREVAPEDAPVFLPYLGGGEQGALWDPALRGSLLGLALHHDRRHLARALLNGIVLESRRCLAVLEEAGLPAGTVHLAGGSAAVPGFAQDLADASSRPVSFFAEEETDASAIGAAMLAARSTGGSLESAGVGVGSGTNGVKNRAALLRPDDERAGVWSRLFARHDSALAALRGLHGDDREGERDHER